MAHKNDSEIIKSMMALPRNITAAYFAHNAHKIIADATYWNVLGTLWKGGGTVIQQDLWKELFNSDRKKRHRIMKKRERKIWRRLPKTVIAYRAINNDSEIINAISWSLSQEIVNNVFSENGRRRIVSREFDKKDIFAYFDRRQEDEILVNVT